MEYIIGQKNADENANELTHQEMMFAAEEIAKISSHIEIIRTFILNYKGGQQELDDFINWVHLFANTASEFRTEPFSFMTIRQFNETSTIEARYSFQFIGKGFSFESTLRRASN